MSMASEADLSIQIQSAEVLVYWKIVLYTTHIELCMQSLFGVELCRLYVENIRSEAPCLGRTAGAPTPKKIMFMFYNF